MPRHRHRPRHRPRHRHRHRSRLPRCSQTLLLLTLAGLGGLGGLAPLPARAQRVVPKIDTICPLGYVDLLNGQCSTLGLMTYTLRPTDGKPCPEGWMNVGGKYCRRK